MNLSSSICSTFQLFAKLFISFHFEDKNSKKNYFFSEMTAESASKSIKIHMEPIPVYHPKVINMRFKENKSLIEMTNISY